jgi:hypothetical protein
MLLVKKGWFKDIEYHLLIPGHSHWVVDRDCFSDLGKLKMRKACATMSEFWTSFVRTAYTNPANRPNPMEPPAIFDFKSWLEHIW